MRRAKSPVGHCRSPLRIILLVFSPQFRTFYSFERALYSEERALWALNEPFAVHFVSVMAASRKIRSAVSVNIQNTTLVI